MNNKIKTILAISMITIGLFILPVVMAQQPNEYRAFLYDARISPYFEQRGANASYAAQITYVPIYPSATYTMTWSEVVVLVDLSQPNNINTQVSQAVKQEGATHGYDVVRVYVPTYEMKVV